MGLSNVVMYFIILATAATLFKAGQTNIRSAADAAMALEPLAGPAAKVLLAVGLIGVGFLAVPILTGSAAYAVAETFGAGDGQAHQRPLDQCAWLGRHGSHVRRCRRAGPDLGPGLSSTALQLHADAWSFCPHVDPSAEPARHVLCVGWLCKEVRVAKKQRAGTQRLQPSKGEPDRMDWPVPGSGDKPSPDPGATGVMEAIEDVAEASGTKVRATPSPSPDET
jgi:hypothetical protein